MPRKTDRRAFSLAEVLVAATLGLLLLGVLLRLFLLTLAASARHTDMTHNHQIATVLLSRLESDLASTGKQGIAMSPPEESGRLFVHPLDRDSGSLKWDRKAVLYEEFEGGLERSVVKLEPPPTGPSTPVDQEGWEELAGGEKLGALRLENVSRFRATLESGPLVRVRFRVGQGEQAREFEKLHFLRQANPR